MADVSYKTLRSGIQESHTKIASQRDIIRSQRESGLKQIEVLRRVHPKTKPKDWFERKGQITGIRTKFGEFTEYEKELLKEESNLAEQEALLKQKESEGWKIREHEGQLQFYKKPKTKYGNPVSTHTDGSGNVLRIEYDTGIVVFPATKQIMYPGGALQKLPSHPTYGGFVKLDKSTVVQEGLVGWYKDQKAQEKLKSEFEAQQKIEWEKVPTEQPALYSLLVSATPEQNKRLKEAVLSGNEEQYKVVAKQIYGKMPPSKKLKYAKEYMTFDGDKTWKEIQKDQPYMDLKVTKSGDIYTDPNLSKWKEDEYKNLNFIEKGARYWTARLFTGFANPDFIKEELSGSPEGQARAQEMITRWEYETKQDVKEGGMLQYGKRIAFSPIVTNVLLPFTGGALIGRAGMLFKGTSHLWSPGTKIVLGGTRSIIQYGAVPTIIGTDIGVTMAKEKHGIERPGATASKISTYGIQFASMGAGYKFATSYKPVVGFRPTKSGVIETQKFLTTIRGKPVLPYGKPSYYGWSRTGPVKVYGQTGMLGAEAKAFKFKTYAQIKAQAPFPKPPPKPTYDPFEIAQSPTWKPSKVGSDMIVSRMGGIGGKVHVGAVGGASGIMKTGITYGALRPLVVRSPGFLSIPKQQPFIDIFKQKVDFASKHLTTGMEWQPKTGIAMWKAKPITPDKTPALKDIFKKKPLSLKPKRKIIDTVTYKITPSTMEWKGKVWYRSGKGWQPKTGIDPFKSHVANWKSIGRKAYIKPYRSPVFDYLTKGKEWQPKTGLKGHPDAGRDAFGRVEPYVPEKKVPTLDAIFKKKPLKIKPIKDTVTRFEVSKDGIVSVEKYGRKFLETGKERRVYPLAKRKSGFLDVKRDQSFIDMFKIKVNYQSKFLAKGDEWKIGKGLTKYPKQRDMYGRVVPYKPTGKELIEYKKVLDFNKKLAKGDQPNWVYNKKIQVDYGNKLQVKTKPKKKSFTLKDLYKQKQIPKGGQVTKDGQIIITKTKVKTTTVVETKPIKMHVDPVIKPLNVFSPTVKTLPKYGIMMEQMFKPVAKPKWRSAPKPSIQTQKDMLSFYPILKRKRKVDYIQTRISKSKQENISKSIQDSLNDYSFKTDQKTFQEQFIDQGQRQGFYQEFKTTSIYDTIFKTGFDFQKIKGIQKSGKPEEETTEIKKPKKRKLPDIPKSKKGIFVPIPGQGYNVYAKERQYFKGTKKKPGKFIKINKKALSERDAMAFGANAIDNSAGASFKIKPSKKMAQEADFKLVPFSKLEKKFYRKKNDNIFIEKTTHRIDSKGEKQGISALGWVAERRTKAKKHKQKMVTKTKKKKEIFDIEPEQLIDWSYLNKIWEMK